MHKQYEPPRDESGNYANFNLEQDNPFQKPFRYA
jgi:hypothetical protein